MKIVLENIDVYYDNKKILDSFSISIEDGERVAVVGKSGIGKTTLLKIITGEIKADGGRAVFSEKPMYSAVFQENLLFEDRTVYENLLFVKDVSREKTEEYLRRMGLEGYIDSRVSELSGGMKRRVSILRALVYSGNLFVFDEALREVDSETRRKIVDIINEDVKETMIFTTHNPEDIKDLRADKVIDLEDRDCWV